MNTFLGYFLSNIWDIATYIKYLWFIWNLTGHPVLYANHGLPMSGGHSRLLLQPHWPVSVTLYSILQRRLGKYLILSFFIDGKAQREQEATLGWSANATCLCRCSVNVHVLLWPSSPGPDGPFTQNKIHHLYCLKALHHERQHMKPEICNK